VAEAQPWGHNVTSRILVSTLFDLRHLGGLRDGQRWGAGNGTMPLAAGTAHGTALQEAVIKVVGYSFA
jgi:hypothetical protein